MTRYLSKAGLIFQKTSMSFHPLLPNQEHEQKDFFMMLTLYGLFV